LQRSYESKSVQETSTVITVINLAEAFVTRTVTSNFDSTNYIIPIFILFYRKVAGFGRSQNGWGWKRPQKVVWSNPQQWTRAADATHLDIGHFFLFLSHMQYSLE